MVDKKRKVVYLTADPEGVVGAQAKDIFLTFYEIIKFVYADTYYGRD